MPQPMPHPMPQPMPQPTNDAFPTVSRDDIVEVATKLRRMDDALTQVKSMFEAFLKPHQDKRDALERQLASMMRQLGIDSLDTPIPNEPDRLYRATFQPKQAGKVVDWEELYEFVLTNKAFHLLPKKLNSTPVVDVYQAALTDWSIKAPGTETFSDKHAFIKNRLPPGTDVTEWEELVTKKVSKPKPRRAKSA